MLGRILGFTVGLIFLLSAQAGAQALGVDEALTIDNTAGGVAIAAATHSPAGRPQNVFCAGKLETAQVRYLDNSDAPTTTVGIPIDVGDVVEIFGNQYIQAARFIRTGSTNGLIHFVCYPRAPGPR